MPLLKLAYERSLEKPDPKFTAFWTENAWWLDDYGLFMAVKDIFGGNSWDQWAEDIRYRWDNAMWYYKTNYSKEIGFYVWLQYLFFTQWQKLKKYANDKGLKIIGDIPIYVAYDSADVWAHPEMFQLDQERKPAAVAGCPPDGFSADGQLWGNPLYDWDVMKESGYAWWLRRLDAAAGMYDVVRLDHFRGFESYWAVPAEDETARNGSWLPGPGWDFIRTIQEKLPALEVIAEDLGYLTPEVRKLQKDSGYPGMKVLEFAFDSREPSDYQPHRYTRNSVCYTGTHDNQTMSQWLQEANPEDVAYAKRYMGLHEEEGYVWGMIRGGMSSVADLFVAQMQDYLELGAEARMNFPGTLTNKNWTWRAQNDMITNTLADRIRELTRMFERL